MSTSPAPKKLIFASNSTPLKSSCPIIYTILTQFTNLFPSALLTYEIFEEKENEIIVSIEGNYCNPNYTRISFCGVGQSLDEAKLNLLNNFNDFISKYILELQTKFQSEMEKCNQVLKEISSLTNK